MQNLQRKAPKTHNWIIPTKGFLFLVRRSCFGDRKGFYLWRKRFFCARLVAHFLADSVNWVKCLKSRARLTINCRLWLILHVMVYMYSKKDSINSIPICFSTSLICIKYRSLDLFLWEKFGFCAYIGIYLDIFGWQYVEKSKFCTFRSRVKAGTPWALLNALCRSNTAFSNPCAP